MVDLTTGQVAASARTDASGHYSLPVVFSDAQHPFIVQTILKNAQGSVAGILAAPLGAKADAFNGHSPTRDLSAVSTVLTFSSCLLTEAYPRFTDATGVSAGFYNPDGIFVDARGVMFVSDGRNFAIRQVR